MRDGMRSYGAGRRLHNSWFLPPSVLQCSTNHWKSIKQRRQAAQATYTEGSSEILQSEVRHAFALGLRPPRLLYRPVT